MRGRDITLPKDTEITAYVDGNLHLKAASFSAASSAAAQADASKP
jgi:hypothetical protein